MPGNRLPAHMHPFVRCARIDEDEEGALGVERDRQLEREMAPRVAGRSPVDPDGQDAALAAEGLEQVVIGSSRFRAVSVSMPATLRSPFRAVSSTGREGILQ